MALKTELWSSLQLFGGTNIDQTFKRSPGLCFRPAGAEEKTLPQRSEKGRPSSCPPLSLEASCFFHHRESTPQPCGPMLYYKSAADCSHDKETVPTKRGLGLFSPQAGATATPPSKSTVAGDFRSRGVCDIDQNTKRGMLQNSQQTSFQHQQQFSEEIEAAIKQCLAILSGGTFSEASEIVQELGCLGIECRRLQAASLSHSDSQQRLPPRPMPVPLPIPSRTSPATSCTTHESKPVPSPILMKRSMRHIVSPGRWNRSLSQGSRSPRKDAGLKLSQMHGVNVNTRRLANSYRTQHTKMPDRALTLSRKTLRSSPGKGSSSCSTFDCSTFEDNDDELGAPHTPISAESGYPNLLESLQASSPGKNKDMSPTSSGSEAVLWGFPLPAIPGLVIQAKASNCTTAPPSADTPNPSSGDCSEAPSEILSEVQMRLFQAPSEPLRMKSSQQIPCRLTAESTQALSETLQEKPSLQSPAEHFAVFHKALTDVLRVHASLESAVKPSEDVLEALSNRDA